MNNQKFDINTLRVASPCSVGWQTMTGDERIRHCHSCQLNIYNTAEMTKNEVEDLILKRDSRLCIRLYRRADGTVITKDCPVGLRAYQKRIARFGGATLTAILGLFSVSFGQNETKSVHASKVQISSTSNGNQKIVEGELTGQITDPNGAVIPGAYIYLFKGDEWKPLKTQSDNEGSYRFESVTNGTYRLEITVPGFKKLIVEELKIQKGESRKLNLTMEIDGETVVVGIFLDGPLIDLTTPVTPTRITREMLDRLPGRRPFD